jgi:hypothetical protein
VKNLRIICAPRNALSDTEFRNPGFLVTSKRATLAVPFFPRDKADDLTFAILYKYAARSYYPLALLLWREKIRQPLR